MRLTLFSTGMKVHGEALTLSEISLPSRDESGSGPVSVSCIEGGVEGAS